MSSLFDDRKRHTFMVNQQAPSSLIRSLCLPLEVFEDVLSLAVRFVQPSPFRVTVPALSVSLMQVISFREHWEGYTNRGLLQTLHTNSTSLLFGNLSLMLNERCERNRTES
jgi:hypothetical protein